MTTIREREGELVLVIIGGTTFAGKVRRPVVADAALSTAPVELEDVAQLAFSLVPDPRGDVSATWLVLPLPISEPLRVTALAAVAPLTGDMAKLYAAQIAGVKAARAGLTLPNGGRARPPIS